MDIFLGITLSGRYVPGLAICSVLADWLRIRFTTHSTALMQFTAKNDILKCTQIVILYL
jgi:hypothetical protein